VKTLGIVGWIGPESTIEYYRLILRQVSRPGAGDAGAGAIARGRAKCAANVGEALGVPSKTLP